MKKLITFLEVVVVVIFLFFAFFFGVQFSDSIKSIYPSLFLSGQQEDTVKEEGDVNKIDDKGIAEIREILEKEDGETLEEEFLPNNDLQTNEKILEERELSDSDIKMPDVMTTTPDIYIPEAEDITMENNADNFEQSESQMPEDKNVDETESLQNKNAEETVEMNNKNEASMEYDIEPKIEEIMPIEENDVTIPESSAREVQIEIGDEPVKIEGLKGVDAEEVVIE